MPSPRSIRRLPALVAAIAVMAALLWLPAPVAAQDGRSWVPLAEATIHPGVQTVTDGGQCTANFVFTDAIDVYIGQAAHCGGGDGSSETDGCRATPPPLGASVRIDGASRPGTLVYNSWRAMQDAGEDDPNTCAFNDFALVSLHPDDRARVNPSIPHYGGPTGVVGTTSSGDTVYTYGNSGLRPGSGAQKAGTSEGQSGGGWTHQVRTTTNPGIPGDSGSAFVDASGRAFGVLSTLEVFPDVGANGVSDLTRMLAWMAADGGPAVSLALGTKAFDIRGGGADTATGSAAGPAVVRRLAGAAGTSRIETAVAVARAGFGAGAAPAVVLARADVAADALAGTALAAGLGAPVLLSPSDSLHPATRAELDRILLRGRTVILLGGRGALGDGVAAALAADGHRTDRIAGASRIETAIAIAERVTDGPRQVLLADGRSFADALVAGPAAHAADGVVVLTDGDRPHPAVDAYLAAHPSASVVAVGTIASDAYPAAQPIVGVDVVDTARLVAERYLPQADVVGLARADLFADALAGGAHVAGLGGPILLTSSDRLSGAVSAHLSERADRIDSVVLYGGTAALSAGVEADVGGIIRAG